VVDHLLPLDLRFGREYCGSGHQLRCQVEDGIAGRGIRRHGYRRRHCKVVVRRYDGISVATAVAPFLVWIGVHAVQINIADRRGKRAQTVGRAEAFGNHGADGVDGGG